MRDYPHMQKNYARARELMARNGNPTQWGDTFPKDDVVRDDIAQRRAMLLVDEVGGHERILAQFALCPGEDPTYHHIDGAWLDDDSYVTIRPRQARRPRLHRLGPQALRQRPRRHPPQQQGHAARPRNQRIRPLRPDTAA